jgi:hypothetical protein
VEVSVARGRQLEALPLALVLQDMGQQLVGCADIVAEEHAAVLCGVPQRLCQLQGPVAIHPSLIAAQLVILEWGKQAQSLQTDTHCPVLPGIQKSSTFW